MADPGDWFVYQRTAGRVTGRPANLKGWLAFLGILLATPAVATPVMAALIHAGHPILGGLALVAVLLAGLYGLFRLMIIKGRRIG